jgi:branched-subunit amino acid ABC-type transport system permease component
MIVVKAFTNEKQRDLFGLIFTLGWSLIIENVVNLLYGPNAVSIALWNRTVWGLITTLVIINIIIVYLFHVSYNGKIRQAIYSQTSSVRSLGVRVNRMLVILMSAILPCLAMLGIIVANEWAIKPSDNLFYLIKWIGIMIMVGVEKKQYVYLGALIYVAIEYLLFIQRWLPIWFKETLILFMILIVLLMKPEWLFSLRSRKI